MLNWPYVYAAGRTDAATSATTKHVWQNMGWAPYPSVYPGVPGKSSVGGANIGISAYSKYPKQALAAALCMTRYYWQNQEAINEGLPPVTIASYHNPTVIKSYPFAAVLLKQLEHATNRPETPYYSDVTLAIQQTLHPPASIKPVSDINSLAFVLDDATRGRSVLMATVAGTPSRGARRRAAQEPWADRARQSRAQARADTGDAVGSLVMILVAGFPILYAIWLSLHRADLRFPNLTAWIGLDNYISVLSSHTWWSDFFNTVIITVFSVALEIVLGLLIAEAMYRALYARTWIRVAVLVPYGAVTVVSAFAWSLAFNPATGFATQWLGLSTPPLTTRAGSFAVIILSDVWKTTPFISLLMLGALALVPEDLYKAAKVDGATAWQRFWRITFP